jgi:alginate O-acetyltransferase complex protein AlgI
VRDFSFSYYLLFITYFPHLIAGPILHHESIIPQFQQRKTYSINWENVASGIILFTIGLFKKIYWADSLAPFADTFFSESYKAMASHALPTTYEAWAAALAYTMQIYFDFSGYTDMALGVALMFNIKMPINFNSPYKATSIIEFWRRWHISLSTFLRDYLYIPLGGSRDGTPRRYRNLITTMVIGGLWHGAGWNFLVWGGVHGAMLTINHIWRGLPEMQGIPQFRKWVLPALYGSMTFMLIIVTWVFFRSNDLSQSLMLLKAMFGIASNPIALAAVADGHLLVMTSLDGRELAELLLLGLAWVWLLPNSNGIQFKSGRGLVVFAQIGLVGLVLCLSINRFGSYSPFLYYQF